MSPLKEGWQGRFFEDFAVGDIYRCRYGRTVTEADNISFTLLTCNTNQIHFNRDYGMRTEWGRCLINSTLTLAIVVGMGVMDVSENGFALGYESVTLPHPLFAGDTLYSESEVLEVRASSSRPAQGIVRVEGRGYNQDGDLVLTVTRPIMVWRAGQGPATAIFPEKTESGKAEASPS